MKPQRLLLVLAAACVGIVVLVAAPWREAPAPSWPAAQLEPAPVEDAAGGVEQRSEPAAREPERSRVEPVLAPTFVAGRVTRLDAGPLPAGIVLGALSLAGDARELIVEDPEGRFRHELAAGDWRLEARAPGWRSPALVVRVGAHEGVEALDLVLMPTAALILCVVEADSAPASPTDVHLDGLHEDEPRVARTEADGCVRFDDLMMGSTRVSVGHPLHPLVVLEVELDAPVTRPDPVRLPPRAALAVLVVDADGNPVEGAEVQALGQRGGWVEATTGPEGAATLEGVPHGRVRIHSRSPREGQADQAVDFSPGSDPRPVLRLRPRPSRP